MSSTAITIYPPDTTAVTIQTPPTVRLSIVEQLVTGSASTTISVQEGLGIDVAGPSGGAYTVSVEFAASGTSSATKAVRADDSRLSNARTPTAHTHVIADVTSLQTALDGKAALAHTHAIADVTGLQTALDDNSNNLTKTARNDTASTITKGQVVYIFGSSGTHLLVRLADADSESTAAPTIGVAQANIAAGADGAILVAGYLEGLSNLPTGSFANGAALWLSSAAGGWTTTPPTQPAHRVFLGWVVTNSNGAAGRAYIKVINGQELDELHNVLITGTTDGLPLVYENSTSLWKNKKLTAAGLENNSVGTNQLKNAEVTFAKLQDIGTGQILGRASVGTGDVEGLTLGAGFVLDAFTQELLLDATPARAELGLATTDSVKFGLLQLQNDEYIRNTVDGRLDFMPAPHPSGDYGIYFDLKTSANYALVGTINSTGGFNTNAGFQFENTLAVIQGKSLDFGNTTCIFTAFNTGVGNSVLHIAPYVGAGHSMSVALVSQNASGSNNRKPTTAHTNPTFYAYAAGDANANDFARLSHDATNATLESGRGKMVVKGASTVRIEGPSGGFDLPATAGSNGQVLTTDGTNASWQTPSGGGVTEAFVIAMAVAL